MFYWFSRASVKNKLFVSYMLIFTFPLFLIGTFSYIWISNAVINQNNRTYESVIRSAVNNVDEQFRSFETMALQLSNTTWIKEIMYMKGKTIDDKRINKIELENYRKQLEGWQISNDFSSDIVIYFTEKDLVLSTIGKSDFQWFTEETFKIENMDPQEWKMLTDGYLYNKVITGLEVKTYQRPRKGIMYLQSLPFSESYNIRAVFMVFVEEGSLNKILSTLFLNKDTIAYITDEHNNIIALENTNYDYISAINKQLSSSQQNRYSDTEIYNKRYYIFRSTSEQNNWTYTVLVPRSIIMKEVDLIKFLTLTIILGSLVMGAFLSYLSAIKHYRPLLKIIEIIRDKVNETHDNSRDNEYLWLESNIQSLLLQEELLSKRLEQQKPVLINAYLMKLLIEDKGMTHEFMKILEILNVSFPFEYFVCCVINNFNETNWKHNRCIRGLNKKINTKTYEVEINNRKIIIINYVERQNHEIICDSLNEICFDINNKNIIIGLAEVMIV